MSVAAIVLAAGTSRRLGRPKQNLRLAASGDDETLLERTIRVARVAELDPVYVVVARLHEYRLGSPAVVLVNQDAPEGMASSIRVGIAAVTMTSSPGVVILACDQPAVAPEHLQMLAAGGSETIASSYAGRNGVPAYLPRSSFPKLMELRGDTGAREILRLARSIPLVHGELDIDTEDDLKSARRLLAGQ